MDSDGTPVSGPAVQRHRLALLALLARAPDGNSTRDRLLAYLWPESDDERARRLLNQSVYQLRRTLGEDAILSGGDELRLNFDVVDVDAGSFEQALARGDSAAAASLYRGALLDGFFLSDAPEFERWVDRERERLAAAYANALEALAVSAEAGHDLPGAAGWWQARAAHDPYDSRIALRLMEAMHAAGNRAGALQHAGVHARQLTEEFGIVPPPEIGAFVERLRQIPAASDEDTVDRRSATGGHRQRTVEVPPPPDAGTIAIPVSAIGRRPKRPRMAHVVTAVVAAALGAMAFWLLGRDTDVAWFLSEAVPRIEDDLVRADWESAFRIAREAERRLPDRPELLTELWPRLSWRVTIASEPAGAMVFRQAYDAPDDAWDEIGRTPLNDMRIPYGLSRLRFELEGHRPLVRAIGGAHINWTRLGAGDPDILADMLLVGPETYRIDTETTLPADKVRVPGWNLRLGDSVIRLDDFFLGRYEVTNAEFRAFVDAGGYRRSEFWDPIVVQGRTVPWSRAMEMFVDRTGRPGPSTWEAGDYPPSEDRYPVSGVSWYEAAAYARFVGEELPTAQHWRQALANSMFPWLLPASNFSGTGARRVTDSRAMTHVGAFDLTGNVREWTSSAIGNERIILGGSWNEPYYIAGSEDSSARPDDRSPGNGFRLAVTFDPPAIAARVRAAIATRTTAAAVIDHEPVSDEVFAAFGRAFDYDRRSLEPIVESADTTRMWIRQRIRYDAGYGAERMLLHLYLPTTARPPFQTVVYWPGWDTFALTDADEYFAKQVDFIAKGGRAVAFPIYRGTFERRIVDMRTRPEFGSAEYRDNTIETVKELRRTIDYLDTRSDVDTSAIAFFGYSWGGVNGPTAMAREPRIRVGVINIGLLPSMTATPEVDPVNALPRVNVPTLLFSGEFDPMVPRDNRTRYFELIGVAPGRKKHVIAIGGHFVPRDLLIRETLDWLDRYLGPVRDEITPASAR